jgi:hypothetical protein
MPKFSAQEALAHLGGSAAQIDQELRRFGEAAKVLSSDHPRMIDEHPLQWIGVYQGKVAATGRSLKSLMAQLRKRSIPPEETIIRFIDKEERALIL